MGSEQTGSALAAIEGSAITPHHTHHTTHTHTTTHTPQQKGRTGFAGVVLLSLRWRAGFPRLFYKLAKLLSVSSKLDPNSSPEKKKENKGKEKSKKMGGRKKKKEKNKKNIEVKNMCVLLRYLPSELYYGEIFSRFGQKSLSFTFQFTFAPTPNFDSPTISWLQSFISQMTFLVILVLCLAISLQSFIHSIHSFIH